jgi:hypothetical protein
MSLANFRQGSTGPAITPMHLKQKHFCQGPRTEHALVDVHRSCAPVGCYNGYLPVTYYKVAGYFFAVDILEGDLLTHLSVGAEQIACLSISPIPMQSRVDRRPPSHCADPLE